MAKKKSKKPPQPYEPTPAEREIIEKSRVRQTANPPLRLKVGDNKITIDHPDLGTATTVLMETLGTADPDFLQGLIAQLAKAGGVGSEPDEAVLNFTLSVLKDIKPKDHIEAMLAAQMAVTHNAIMTFTPRLGHEQTLNHQDSNQGAFNKLVRTFAMLVDAFKRYRTGGEQKVTVQHVTVGEGGQAIVGNITQAERKPSNAKARQSQPALTHAQTVPMEIIGETERVAVKRK